MLWNRHTFGNTKTKFKEKHKMLEELIFENKAEHLDQINRTKAEMNRLLNF